MGTESPSGSWLSRLPCRRNEIKTLEIQIELMQTPSNTVRRLTETEVNSSTYQEQVRDRGVPQSYPDEWLELRWIRPGQTSLIPLQCRREKRKRRGFTSIQMLHTHTHPAGCLLLRDVVVSCRFHFCIACLKTAMNSAGVITFPLLHPSSNMVWKCREDNCQHFHQNCCKARPAER